MEIFPLDDAHDDTIGEDATMGSSGSWLGCKGKVGQRRGCRSIDHCGFVICRLRPNQRQHPQSAGLAAPDCVESAGCCVS